MISYIFLQCYSVKMRMKCKKNKTKKNSFLTNFHFSVYEGKSKGANFA